MACADCAQAIQALALWTARGDSPDRGSRGKYGEKRLLYRSMFRSEGILSMFFDLSFLFLVCVGGHQARDV
jgi:hypothetical protein